jgi:V/A-type H+-transporting ATPase subunit D
MADVNPTRMELMKIKERITLARKGYKLLKQKRDALILEFFKILKKSQDLRGELTKAIGAAYTSVSIAEIYHSAFELQNVSLNMKKKIELDVEVKNVMGVKIPAITSNIESLPASGNYSIAATSAKIDNAVQSFSPVFDMVLKLAETETAIKRLILEIEKTKRRVNALDYVLIPKLEKTMKEISFRLDEMERDSFVSLKVIKRKLEKEKKAKLN